LQDFSASCIIKPLRKAKGSIFRRRVSHALPKAKETNTTAKPVKRTRTAKKYAPCPLSHEPNEETIQALREADAGIGLTRCKDIDDLWKKLHE